MNFLLITFNRNELAAKGSPEGPERIRKEHVLCSMRYRSRGTRGRVCSSMWTGKGSHRDYTHVNQLWEATQGCLASE